MSNNKIKSCITFVCEPGELEVKSMLLAASIRLYNDTSIELVAALPSHYAPEDFAPDTHDLLCELNIRTEKITNPLCFDYPIGNKLACLNIDSTAHKIIFLDSDMLCMKAIPAHAFPAAICAKPADLATYSKYHADWNIVYQLFDLLPPTLLIMSTASQELMPPYFNAGVIAIDNGIDLYTSWTESCRRIDQDNSITNKRPWLDQIGLPVAIARLGYQAHCLSESLNYPAHLKPLTNKDVTLCHYHWPSVIERESTLRQLTQTLINKHPSLKALINNSNQAWQSLLATQAHAPITSAPNLVITGIPRSGTSLLCRLLDDLPNSVIINEPADIFEPLNNPDIPEWISIYYQELRSKINRGETIENKVSNGQITEDTKKCDERMPYHPSVKGPNFILGTKNTLAYMNRLSLLKRALPHAPIITCIRHPLDTIASWKNSFPHLNSIDFGLFPTGYTNSLFLTGTELNRLNQISKMDDPALKRALLWHHLTEVIKDNADRLLIIRYEDLVADPNQELSKILDVLQIRGDTHQPQASPLTPRINRGLLNNTDIQTITNICTTNASYFGYQL